MKNYFYVLLGIVILLFSAESSFGSNGNLSKSPCKGDTIKILAIGNSFSRDAIEQNLYELAKAEGLEVVIGNMYIGGCSLERHANNIADDKGAYSYRKQVGGVKDTIANMSISRVLKDENWDYISIQEASGNSGFFRTFQIYLPGIMKYLRCQTANQDVTFMLHQTWAYATTSTHKQFPQYDSDQMKMYNMIVDTYKKAKRFENFKIVIPSGVAIQNARASVFGDNLCSDGYHLNANGQYIAACTWFEMLFNKDVRKNTYKLPNMTEEEAKAARSAAYEAAHNSCFSQTCEEQVTDCCEKAEVTCCSDAA